MARKQQFAVEPRPGARWTAQTDGTSRADSLHDRKSEAVVRARELRLLTARGSPRHRCWGY